MKGGRRGGEEGRVRVEPSPACEGKGGIACPAPYAGPTRATHVKLVVFHYTRTKHVVV